MFYKCWYLILVNTAIQKPGDTDTDTESLYWIMYLTNHLKPFPPRYTWRSDISSVKIYNNPQSTFSLIISSVSCIIFSQLGVFFLIFVENHFSYEKLRLHKVCLGEDVMKYLKSHQTSECPVCDQNKNKFCSIP